MIRAAMVCHTMPERRRRRTKQPPLRPPALAPASCPALRGSPFPWKRRLPGVNHLPILPASLPAGAIPARFHLVPLQKRPRSRHRHIVLRHWHGSPIPALLPGVSLPPASQDRSPASLYGKAMLHFAVGLPRHKPCLPGPQGFQRSSPMSAGRGAEPAGITTNPTGWESPLCPCYFIMTQQGWKLLNKSMLHTRAMEPGCFISYLVQ